MTCACEVERVAAGPRGRVGLVVTTGSTSLRAGEIGVKSRGFCTGVTGSGEWNVCCGGESPAAASFTVFIAPARLTTVSSDATRLCENLPLVILLAGSPPACYTIGVGLCMFVCTLQHHAPVLCPPATVVASQLFNFGRSVQN